MRLGKDIVGKPIYTIREGKHIGKVKDLYLDHNLYWMTGIHLGKEGFIRRKEMLITRDDVVVFGTDAILVKDDQSVTDDKTIDTDSWLRLDDLTGRDIDTPGGTRLANVGDVILDPEGRITGFALSKVSVDGPIAENGAIAREVVIDNGHEDGVMTIDLIRAEQIGVPKEKTAESAEADPAADPAAE